MIRAWLPEALMLLGAYRVYRFVVLSAPAAWLRRLVRFRWLMPIANTVEPLAPKLAARLRRRARERDRMPGWRHGLVWLRTLGHCQVCGRYCHPAEMQTDHWYRAWSAGGSDGIPNLRPLCPHDNRAKGATPAARLEMTR